MQPDLAKGKTLSRNPAAQRAARFQPRVEQSDTLGPGVPKEIRPEGAEENSADDCRAPSGHENILPGKTQGIASLNLGLISPGPSGQNLSDDWLLWQLADSAFPTGGFAH